MKKVIVHLVSDSSGQTVKYAANTALAQFNNLEVKKYHWPMVRNEKLLEDVFSKIISKKGIVIYTMSSRGLRTKLKNFCLNMKIPCISVVGRMIDEISSYIGVKADNITNSYNRFDDGYFDKVEAIEYSLKHDDGQCLDNLEESDIIIIGCSRTSKTPTSVYLAYNGFKTANIPFVYNCDFPDFLKHLLKPLIVGLVINPSRLIEIRESRLNLMQVKEPSNYTDIKIVKEECSQVRKICTENNWLTIDVSRRSIEETAGTIIRAYYEHRQKNKI